MFVRTDSHRFLLTPPYQVSFLVLQTRGRFSGFRLAIRDTQYLRIALIQLLWTKDTRGGACSKKSRKAEKNLNILLQSNVLVFTFSNKVLISGEP